LNIAYKLWFISEKSCRLFQDSRSQWFKDSSKMPMEENIIYAYDSGTNSSSALNAATSAGSPLIPVKKTNRKFSIEGDRR